LPTSAWNSVAPLSSSAANARASVIGATGLRVRWLVIVVQIRSSGIRPRLSATGYDTSAVNGGIDIGLIIGET
jgi:hypothetical protein